MTRDEFYSATDRENIMPHSYSLYDTKDDSFVLDKIGDAWCVYYTERGSQSKYENFQTESDALEYLLKTLMKSHTSRQRPRGL
ncbi:hypothetical protein MesoLj113b_30590 [Mesorhizobium sp. 113-3-3]|nr:hypothetical protein MesoLj113b_30590 [Mesorhizobium sp. 113-3-3]